MTAGTVKQRFFRRAVFLLAVCLGFSALSCRKAGRENEKFSLTVFDVGEASAALLRTPEGTILIDAGGEAGQEELVLRLRSRKVTDLSLIVLTHSDEDHIGGADAILNEFPTAQVWVNGMETESDSYGRMIRAAREAGTPVRAVTGGDAERVAGVLLSVFSPIGEERVDGNETGIVLRAAYEEVSVLFTGDAGEATEKRLLAEYGAAHFRSDILIVGHHGAAGSSTESFLEAVSPAYALISCGAGNAYGHPDGRTLDRLARIGTTVLRTDRQGEISIFSDGKSGNFEVRIAK